MIDVVERLRKDVLLLEAERAELKNAFDTDQRAIEDNKRLRAERDALLALLVDIRPYVYGLDNIKRMDAAIDAARKPNGGKNE